MKDRARIPSAPLREPSPEDRKASAEVERRLRATAEEILRGEWHAYAAAAVPERVGEYEQLLKDLIQLSVLAKSDLLADYLRVVGSEQYGVESSAEINLAIAEKVIARRRVIELEVLPAMLVPEEEPPVAPSGPVATGWKIVSRIVVGIAAICFGLGGVALVLDDSSALSRTERVEFAVALLGVTVLLVVMFFTKWGQQRMLRNTSSIKREAMMRGARRAIEDHYKGKL